MSVHAGAERNVCIIKVSAETPQSTTNPSQAAPHVLTSTLTPVSPPRLFGLAFCAKYQVSSTGPNRLAVCLYNLSTRMYASVHEIFTYRKCHESNKSAHFF